jgi:Protein of unknown function (DUF2924)
MSRSNKQDRPRVSNSVSVKAQWERTFASDVPRQLGIDLRTALLVQGIQEKGLGSAYKVLDRKIQSSLDKTEKALLTKSSLAIGTRLIRGWQGVNHEVQVVNRGFVYRATKYQSLSEIARLITGTRWSGPRFFCVKKSAP